MEPQVLYHKEGKKFHEKRQKNQVKKYGPTDYKGERGAINLRSFSDEKKNLDRYLIAKRAHQTKGTENPIKFVSGYLVGKMESKK